MTALGLVPTLQVVDLKAPLSIKLGAALLTLQAGALMFAAANTLAAGVFSNSCIVSKFLLSLAGLLVLVILWPICGFVVVVGHQLTRLASWARVAYHFLYGLEAAAGILIFTHFRSAGIAAIAHATLALILVWLPSAQAAFKNSGGAGAAIAAAAAGALEADMIGTGRRAFRYGAPHDPITGSWAGAWVALMRDPWARWVTAIALVLAVLVGYSARTPPGLGRDGLPLKPTHAFIAARPEAALAAPGAVPYITQIDGAECGSAADAYLDFSSTQSSATAFAWYDTWLRTHGWKRQPPTPYQEETIANGYPGADYLRGSRESFSIDFSSPDAPPYHGGVSAGSVPAGAVTVWETAYIIKASS